MLGGKGHYPARRRTAARQVPGRGSGYQSCGTKLTVGRAAHCDCGHLRHCRPATHANRHLEVANASTGPATARTVCRTADRHGCRMLIVSNKALRNADTYLLTVFNEILDRRHRGVVSKRVCRPEHRAEPLISFGSLAPTSSTLRHSAAPSGDIYVDAFYSGC